MIQEEQRAVVSFRRRLERGGGPLTRRRYEVAPGRGGRAAASCSSGRVSSGFGVGGMYVKHWTGCRLSKNGRQRDGGDQAVKRASGGSENGQ